MDFDYRLFFIALIQGILVWPAFGWGFLSVTRKFGVSQETKSLRDFMYTILAALSACFMLALVLLLPLLIIVRIPLQNRLNFYPTYGITLLVGMVIYRIVRYFLKKRAQ
jgi:hypothetical protein